MHSTLRIFQKLARHLSNALSSGGLGCKLATKAYRRAFVMAPWPSTWRPILRAGHSQNTTPHTLSGWRAGSSAHTQVTPIKKRQCLKRRPILKQIKTIEKIYLLAVPGFWSYFIRQNLKTNGKENTSGFDSRYLRSQTIFHTFRRCQL